MGQLASKDLYEYLSDWYYVLANANELGQLCPGTDIEKDLRRVATDRITKTLQKVHKRTDFADDADGEGQYLWNIAEFIMGTQSATDNNPTVSRADVTRVRRYLHEFGIKDVGLIESDPDNPASWYEMFYTGDYTK